ncbi:MAG: hypothetical protein ACYDH9_11155 [Limisphaerales bacterium]
MITTTEAAQVLGWLGGSRSTPAKKLAAKRRAAIVWDEIRCGLRPLPRNWKSTPKITPVLVVGPKELCSKNGKCVMRNGRWLVIATGEPYRKG